MTQKVVSKAEGRIVDLRDRRASPGGGRVRASAGTAIRDRSRWSSASPPRSFAWSAACSSAGRSMASCVPTQAWMRRTSGPRDTVTLLPEDPDRVGARDPRTDRRGTSGWRWPSSSATRSAGRGASGSWTWRWASPASTRWTISGADPTRTAGSCTRPWSRSPTRSLRRRAGVGQDRARRPLVLVRGAALPPGDGSVRRRCGDAPRDRPVPASDRAIRST